MLQNSAYRPAASSKVPVQCCLAGKGSTSPTNAPSGSLSSSTVPSAASGSLAGSSARTTTSSCASAPALLASKVTVPAGTSARAGSTDHSLSSTVMVASLEPASPTGLQAAACPE